MAFMTFVSAEGLTGLTWLGQERGVLYIILSLECDHVIPTQRNETSSRSQGGGRFLASNSSSAASAQVAVTVALQPVNT